MQPLARVRQACVEGNRERADEEGGGSVREEALRGGLSRSLLGNLFLRISIDLVPMSQ